MADLAIAYRKTDAGVEELAGRRLGLTREQRNLLIVADGRHPLSVYAKVVGGEDHDLASLADALLDLGLIEAASLAAAHPRHEAHAAAHQADGAGLLVQLTALANSVFGDQAGPVLKKLDKAGTAVGELMTAVDSGAKLAKLTIDGEQAERFLAEARKLLAGH